jgi:hypothetical protein
VLITSRARSWARVAEPVPLEALDRSEAVDFLHRRTGDEDADAAAKVAELLGDLPLALDEAAAFVEATGTSLRSYAGLIQSRLPEVLALDCPADGMEGDAADEMFGRRRISTVWSVSLARVRKAAPAAEAMLELLSVLGPEVQRNLLPAHCENLPPELAAVAADPLAFDQTVAVLADYSLVELRRKNLVLHRLVQAVVRARMGPEHERDRLRHAVDLLVAELADRREASLPTELRDHVLAVCDHAERLGLQGRANRRAACMRGDGRPCDVASTRGHRAW